MPSPGEWRPLPPLGAALLLGALALGAALALGGVFASACGLLAVSGGVLMALAPLPTAPRQGARSLLWLGAGLVSYMLLTITPLPLAWLARIAPAQAAVWERALRPFGDAVTWATVSLDPTATANEITKLLTYGCVFVVALGLAERRRGTSSLERVVCAVTSILVLVSLGHWALGESEVLGLYQPELARDPRHVSVLLNANHLAEVMAIGGAVAAGVLVTAKERHRQIEAALTLALATLGSAVAASRGGLVALAVGVVVALVGSKGRGAHRARLVTLAALLIGAVGVGAVAASDAITREAFSQDLEKLDIFRQSLPLLFRYGLLGIGRGAFESVSPEARRDLGSYVFTHPENLLLQWSIEWGVIVTLVVVVVLARALAPSVLRGRAIMPWGAYGALLAFLVQNQVDYGSEVPAIMVLVTCCLALVTGGARVVSTPVAERPIARVRHHAPRALGLFAVLAGALTFLAADHELWVESRELTRTLRDRDFSARLRQAIRRHPAEAHFAYLGAVHAAQVERRTVLPWVARVLERSPVHGRAHALLARELEGYAPAQARLEYRLAFAQDSRTRSALADAAGRLATGFQEATELVPRAAETIGSGEAGSAALLVDTPATLRVDTPATLRVDVPAEVRVAAVRTVATTLEPIRPATRDRLLRWIALDTPATTELVAPLARAAVDDVVLAAPWCADDEPACLREAQDLVRRWLELAPLDVLARVAAAKLIAIHDPGAALDMLARAESLVDDPPTLLLAASELAERAGLGRAAAELLDRAADRCSGAEGCVPVLTAGVAMERRRGHPERALVLLRRRTLLQPHEAAAWREQADVAERLGLFTESSEALEQVAVLVPNDAAALEGLRRLRAAERTRALPKLPRAD